MYKYVKMKILLSEYMQPNSVKPIAVREIGFYNYC